MDEKLDREIYSFVLGVIVFIILFASSDSWIYYLKPVIRMIILFGVPLSASIGISLINKRFQLTDRHLLIIRKLLSLTGGVIFIVCIFLTKNGDRESLFFYALFAIGFFIYVLEDIRKLFKLK